MKPITYIILLFCFISAQGAFYPPVMADKGMVASDHYLASRVGVEILRQGGNAMDAAVAVGYALAVVDPCCGNIGGGGFMLVHWHDGQNKVLDFRETAPAKINPSAMLKSKNPYLFVGVPGTVLGLNTALKKYGTLSLDQVMAPAIRLAQKGFSLNHFDKATNKRANIKAPNPWVQPKLAKTLALISQKGSASFYHGKIGKEMIAAIKAHGGLMTMADLANYKVIWRTPLNCKYRGYQIITAPPPSSGTTICQILKSVQKFNLAKLGFHSASTVVVNIKAMREAFHSRNTQLGDPAFHQNTTHYVIMDKQGNVVSTTYTLNSLFGIKKIAGQAGFYLNNELDDFALKVGHVNQFHLKQGKANLIKPNKRPLSSMSPVIVFKDKQPRWAMGAAGGPTIITAIVEAIENLIDFGMDVRAAIDMPRYHTQWHPDKVYMEPFAFSKDTQHKLTRMRLVLEAGLFGKYPRWGAMNIAELKKGVFHGASDNRRPNGRAIGLGKTNQIQHDRVMY